jgi:hypothetical protein
LGLEITVLGNPWNLAEFLRQNSMVAQHNINGPRVHRPPIPRGSVFDDNQNLEIPEEDEGSA